MLRIEAALGYARGGWPVFPCNNKQPLTEHGCKDATCDEGQITLWWRRWPEANIGIATGAVSSLVVLDVDQKNGVNGEESLKALLNGHQALPRTFEVGTPTGGRHLYFKRPDGVTIKNSASKLGPGLDIRGEGGYAIAAGSITEFGAYKIKNDSPIAPLPDWLHEKIEKIKRSNSKRNITSQVLDGIPEGRRNDQIFRYAAKLRSDGIPEIEAKKLVLDAASKCNPPLPEHEALQCLKSAWRYAEGFHCTDCGNAQRLVNQHGADIRFIHKFKKWVVWDGSRWVFDEDGAIIRLAKDTVRSIYADAAEEPDADRRRALSKWAAQSESDQRIRAMINLAQSEPGIPIAPEQLDADPWLLSVTNGVIDLRCGALREPRREDYITKRAHVEYIRGAQCPTWEKFLDHIFAGKRSVIEFVQRAAGYSLTGDTSEQCFFLCWGGGANGKTTLLNTERELAGDYALQANPAAFMTHDRGGANNDIARLRGARLVSAIETEDGQRLAESLVKQLTGQDTIAARFLYGEFFEFKPAFKLWLAANHKPVIRGDDYAIWRRIHLIPFTVTIPPAEQDRDLPDKLMAELPGILNWALAGCRAWQEQGLTPPDEVKAATAEYRRESDLMQDFIEACCVVTEKARVGATVIYHTYKKWAEDTGHHPISQTRFGRKLAERGFGKRNTGRGIEYHGLGLLEEHPGAF